MLCVGLLCYALFGNPPYAFYGLMKVALAGTFAAGAYFAFTQSRWASPLSIVLLGLGYEHLFGKHRRAEWEVWNQWGAIAAACLAVFCVLSLLRSKKRLTPETPVD